MSPAHRGDIVRDPLFAGAEGNTYNLDDSRPVFEAMGRRPASTSGLGARPIRTTTIGGSRLRDDPVTRIT